MIRRIRRVAEWLVLASALVALALTCEAVYRAGRWRGRWRAK